MAWVDLLLLVLLLLSAATGFWRGLLFEVMSLLGWVAAYFAAVWFSPVAAPHIPVGTPGGALNGLTSLIVVFVTVLIVWALLSQLLRMLLRATPLSLIDRLLGAMFGLIRGVLILLLIYVAVGWTPWSRSEAWAQSQVRPWLAVTCNTLAPLLPASWARVWRY